mmetsp:Transcript_14971/g.24022  ORF Transcript_14971/g.24022 Transcript_14971/m.24022 type:complete len:99 (-) Transcript_14971:253-549(-)
MQSTCAKVCSETSTYLHPQHFCCSQGGSLVPDDGGGAIESPCCSSVQFAVILSELRGITDLHSTFLHSNIPKSVWNVTDVAQKRIPVAVHGLAFSGLA